MSSIHFVAHFVAWLQMYKWSFGAPRRTLHCGVGHSANVNKLALPPAAVVLMVSVRSLANFSR